LHADLHGMPKIATPLVELYTGRAALIEDKRMLVPN
jgi:hypothetical protein